MPYHQTVLAFHSKQFFFNLRPVTALTCDETRNAKFGAISAPVDMGGNYINNIDCTWTIMARYDYRNAWITVIVTEMDIASTGFGTCEQDYLQVRVVLKV